MKTIHAPLTPWGAVFGLLVALLSTLGGCSKPDRPTLALYPALERGDLDQIGRHIYWDSDINAVIAPNGRRPLHIAAETGRIVITRLLLDNHAEIDAADSEGRTPLFLAVMAGRTQVAQLLIDRGARLEPDQLLHAAVEKGVSDRDVIRFLTAQGAKVDTVDASGETPLIRATRLGEREMAKLLIAQGADVNVRDAQGRSALAWAKQGGHEEIVRLLLRNGAIDGG